jgi:Rhs element Vgr protein
MHANLAKMNRGITLSISNTFAVLILTKFTGQMGLSEYFNFDIQFYAPIEENAPIKPDTIMGSGISLDFSEYHCAASGVISGVVTKFSLDGIITSKNGSTYGIYSVKMQPYLSWFAQTKKTRFFVNQSLNSLLETILASYQGVNPYNIKILNPALQGSACIIPFSFQYEESDANYLARILEKYGLYFYFLPDGAESMMIWIVDNSIKYSPVNAYAPVLDFEQHPTGTAKITKWNVFSGLSTAFESPPLSVTVKSYDYTLATKKIEKTVYSSSAEKAVLATQATGDAATLAGIGAATYPLPPTPQGYTVERWSCDITKQDGVTALANIIMNSYKATEEVITIVARGNLLFPGTTITLANYPIASFNKEYFILTATLDCDMTTAAMSANVIGLVTPAKSTEIFTTTITVIPATARYYSPVVTEPTKISGVLPAKIDDSDESGIIKLNNSGEYKISLPIASSAMGNKAVSGWIRKMESSIYNDSGTFYPLAKGTEVLVAFQDGHPDVPIIIGSVANSLNPSVVTSTNQSQTITKLTPVMLTDMYNLYMKNGAPAAMQKLVNQQVAAKEQLTNNAAKAGSSLSELSGTIAQNPTWNPGAYHFQYEGKQGDESIKVIYPNGSYHTITHKAIVSSQTTDTYQINLGNTYSLTEGDSHTIMNGDSFNLTQGHSNNTNHADSLTKTYGDMRNETFGRSVNITHANQSFTTYLGTMNTNLGGLMNVTLGGSDDVTFGVDASMCFGAKILATFGHTFNAKGGGKLRW